MIDRVCYRKRYLKCQVEPSASGRIRAAIDQLPAAMTGQVTSLDIKGPLAGTRHRGIYRLRVGPYRVVFRPLPDEILVLEVDRRDDHTYADLDRLAIIRRGRGVHVVETRQRPPAEPVERRSIRTPTRRALRPAMANPLTPFAHEELLALGLAAPDIEAVRGFSSSIDIASALAERNVAPEAVELVSDSWDDPARYLAIFASGRPPTVEDARIEDSELAMRLRDPASADAVAELTGREFELVLRGSIEEWMFYLHPSQAQIVTHLAGGPSRVRGGPGTGKTVVALHRARHLVKTGQSQHVLLTTFVNVLPAVWTQLLRAFAEDEAAQISARTVDSVVAQLVGRPIDVAGDGEQRKVLDAVIRKLPGLTDVIGGASALLREIETVLAGRGIASLDEYLAADRTGTGVRLAADGRALVWDAYERYRKALRRMKKDDFALLRLEALVAASKQDVPDDLRFDAVIVDEAQDLTLAQIQLLKALDRSPAHSGFMVAGDSQQSIYPGGFSLRSAGLDVRGRSFVLRTNWRNTQAIAQAADDALGPVEVRDMDDEVKPRASRETALPIRPGDPPELWLATAAEMRDVLSLIVGDALEQDVLPHEIAVLARTNKLWQEAQSSLDQAGIATTRMRDLTKTAAADTGVRVGTFEGSKGLEFKVVVLYACSGEQWAVSPVWLRDEEERADWWQREVRKLFVAMTRARDRLVVLSNNPLPRPLERARTRFEMY